MLLRPRQERFVGLCFSALDDGLATVGVAPTGAGKTVCFSSTICRVLDSLPNGSGSALVLQHRDELTDQNVRTYRAVDSRPVAIFNATEKNFATPGVTFAMVPSLVRSLDQIPPVDLLVIDEAHHATAMTYRKIIDAARERNPDLKLFGVTATPMRGDRHTLKVVFDSVADVIEIGELIREGHLVPPRTFVVDVGISHQLEAVREQAAKHRHSEERLAVQSAELLNQAPLNARVVEEWDKVASDRQTIVFTGTVEHAQAMTEEFQSRGITAATVWGDMSASVRASTLDQFERGEIQVLTNVAVLTEGYDNQTVSCIVLLRACSQRPTMIQMIGRGLRKVDPARHPGVFKDDCIVMDFGYSLLAHGELVPEGAETGEIDGSTKTCPACESTVPEPVRICPLCGHEFAPPIIQIKLCPECRAENPIQAHHCHQCGAVFDGVGREESIARFEMTEIELLNASPFRYESFFDGLVRVADAFEASAFVVRAHGRTYAIGTSRNPETGYRQTELIANQADDRLALQTADDFLRRHGDKKGANKVRSWLRQPPSDRQVEMLKLDPHNHFGWTRYQASCMLSWKFQERRIKAILESAIGAQG